MFTFGKLFNYNHSKYSNDCYGALVDIGSGSVMVAIIHSNKSSHNPEIIWHDRIMTTVKNIDSLQESLRPILVAIFTALLKLDSEGRKSLLKVNKKAKITNLYCTISAPWSKIVIKDIKYKQEKPFLITETLLEELEAKAEIKIKNSLKNDKNWKATNLDLVDQNIIELLANGYHVSNSLGQKAKNIDLTQINVVVHKKISNKIRELQEKIFPETNLKITSFMFSFFNSLKNEKLKARNKNYWLIDITREATEIALVKQGALSHCDFISFGQLSLAREVSFITKKPIQEILSFFNSNNPYGFTERVTPKQKKEIEKVFSAYTNKISELIDNIIKETNFQASSIIFHSNFQSETLFYHLINEIFSKEKESDDIFLTPFSQTDLGKKRRLTSSKTYSDSALLVCAQFFHINV